MQLNLLIIFALISFRKAVGRNISTLSLESWRVIRAAEQGSPLITNLFYKHKDLTLMIDGIQLLGLNFTIPALDAIDVIRESTINISSGAGDFWKNKGQRIDTHGKIMLVMLNSSNWKTGRGGKTDREMV